MSPKKKKAGYDVVTLQAIFDEMIMDHQKAEGGNASAGLRARKAAQRLREDLKAYRAYSLERHRE